MNPIFKEYYSHVRGECYKVRLPWTKFAKETLVLCPVSDGLDQAVKLASIVLKNHTAQALADQLVSSEEIPVVAKCMECLAHCEVCLLPTAEADLAHLEIYASGKMGVYICLDCRRVLSAFITGIMMETTIKGRAEASETANEQ